MKQENELKILIEVENIDLNSLLCPVFKKHNNAGI